MTDATNNDLPETTPASSNSGCGDNCNGCDCHEDVVGEDINLDSDSVVTIYESESDLPMEAAFQQFLESTTEEKALAEMTAIQIATVRFAYMAGAVDALRILKDGVILLEDDTGNETGTAGYSLSELQVEVSESIEEFFSESTEEDGEENLDDEGEEVDLNGEPDADDSDEDLN